ncbi:uncharacterized protein LOC143035642 [Oratosquilla oratoria]|uniref:uncharacterized protein LOC143035642 n=1 Tax=Oratosquilla oratoria TaxID=337810 RepID=UPI003F7650D4
MLSCLTDKITETNHPESQCGFRKLRSTTDTVFCLSQLQEKAREQKKYIFIAFVDLTKAFDTVNRPLLWLLLEKMGVPPKFLFVLKGLHEGMQARIQVIELQYADGCAIVAHDTEDVQNILNVFSFTYADMGLRVNTLKTEILVQTIHPPETPNLFLVNGEPVKTVEHFTYLGSVVHSECSVDLDIQRRVNLSSTAFGHLRDRVFSNSNLRIDTKAAV